MGIKAGYKNNLLLQNSVGKKEGDYRQSTDSSIFSRGESDEISIETSTDLDHRFKQEVNLNSDLDSQPSKFESSKRLGSRENLRAALKSLHFSMISWNLDLLNDLAETDSPTSVNPIEKLENPALGSRNNLGVLSEKNCESIEAQESHQQQGIKNVSIVFPKFTDPRDFKLHHVKGVTATKHDTLATYHSYAAELDSETSSQTASSTLETESSQSQSGSSQNQDRESFRSSDLESFDSQSRSDEENINHDSSFQKGVTSCQSIDDVNFESTQPEMVLSFWKTQEIDLSRSVQENLVHRQSPDSIHIKRAERSFFKSSKSHLQHHQPSTNGSQTQISSYNPSHTNGPKRLSRSISRPALRLTQQFDSHMEQLSEFLEQEDVNSPYPNLTSSELSNLKLPWTDLKDFPNQITEINTFECDEDTDDLNHIKQNHQSDLKDLKQVSHKFSEKSIKPNHTPSTSSLRTNPHEKHFEIYQEDSVSAFESDRSSFKHRRKSHVRNTFGSWKSISDASSFIKSIRKVNSNKSISRRRSYTLV